MRLRRLALVLALLGLAACGRAERARSVSDYLAHPAERSAKVKACSDRPRAGPPVDCAAALSAEAKAESERSLRYARPESRLQPKEGL